MLVQVLSAIEIWDESIGKVDADVDWEMTVRSDVVFTKTVLPGVLLFPEGRFLDETLVQNTRPYIERIAAQINVSHAYNALDGCAVLCRRLAETLIIEVYEEQGLASTIIDGDGNYKMLDALVKTITSETAFNVGRNVKQGLSKIKEIGDRSAHSRMFNAKYNDLEQLRQPIRDVTEGLVQLAGIQRAGHPTS